jgi:transglutaminase-like putative cysteine protease
VNRRRFLQSAGLLSACAGWLRAGKEEWRTFEVVTTIDVAGSSKMTRVWAPAALLPGTPFQRTISNQFQADGGKARIVQTKADGLGIVVAEFPPGSTPHLTVTSRVATKNYSVNFDASPAQAKLDPAELKYYTRPTRLLPTDGIVKETANEITRGARTDLEKARAIYEWIVDNTFRDPKTRGCGLGNIRFMLESRDLGGKCADLNALYVGLARASGLPARDVYGIRVAKSELGYKSLGTASENITKAQHCRAEVFIAGHGWMPVDPADVRKVVLEEPPGNRPLSDEMVRKARERLFGSWEMNWIAYNFARDVALPGSSGAPLGFLMYPQAENSEGRLDCLDPDHFRYQITAREVSG